MAKHVGSSHIGFNLNLAKKTKSVRDNRYNFRDSIIRIQYNIPNTQ